MNHEDNCIFCQIVQGKAPCYKLYEDDLTITFLDIFPAARGHLLIVTKEHFADIFTAEPAAVAKVAENSVRIAQVLDSKLAPDGLGVYQLNRAPAGQTVFHYHMHLIPRVEGEGLDIHAKSAADPAALEDLVETLKPAIQQALK